MHIQHTTLKLFFILSIIAQILLNSCNLRDVVTPPTGNTRSYYLGFTPFPYDVTAGSLDTVYLKIKNDADIISHHFDDGIPWQESLYGENYSTYIINDWQTRKAKTPPGAKIIVSVTPINFNRNGLALYKSSSSNQPLAYPWNTYTFNNIQVENAYLNYCRRIIRFFNPDYLVIGIEVNLLINSDPTLNLWNSYLQLHQYVYSKLKSEYPSLPIMVSLSGMDLLQDYSSNYQLQQIGLDQIMQYSDYFAISLYPFLSSLSTNEMPSNLFDLLFSLENKPICITETGYPAQTTSLYNGSIVLNGTQQKQNDYFNKLFSAADKYNLIFIINFVIQDYDKLWKALGSPEDISKAWRDTGLYDENGNARLAYETWNNKLSISVQF
ncbi:hypothetical protein ABRY23_05190 [Melioribacteraceae bacterium 4301-Me]|uniref:hypothetical protein n=1 Tax=Pyranulibacter aquaticus TaxID=3163344 RepID=UPI003598085D